jgi:hypothetical protein
MCALVPIPILGRAPLAEDALSRSALGREADVTLVRERVRA